MNSSFYFESNNKMNMYTVPSFYMTCNYEENLGHDPVL
jgi:hypothetical protein